MIKWTQVERFPYGEVTAQTEQVQRFIPRQLMRRIIRVILKNRNRPDGDMYHEFSNSGYANTLVYHNEGPLRHEEWEQVIQLWVHCRIHGRRNEAIEAIQEHYALEISGRENVDAVVKCITNLLIRDMYNGFIAYAPNWPAYSQRRGYVSRPLFVCR